MKTNFLFLSYAFVCSDSQTPGMSNKLACFLSLKHGTIAADGEHSFREDRYRRKSGNSFKGSDTIYFSKK